MAEPSCGECRESIAEFALNILTGRELANLQDHLERCADCRDRAAALAVTADRLVELLPAAEPPAGFSHRVADTLRASTLRATPKPADPLAAPALRVSLAPLTSTRGPLVQPTNDQPNRASKTTRPLATALPILTAMIITLAGTSGWVWHHSSDHHLPTPTPTMTEPPGTIRNVVYVPLTGHTHPVGQLYLYPGTPSWIYLQINNTENPRDETLNCVIIRPDGTSIPLGTMTLHKGRGHWGGPTQLTPDKLAATKLITPSGDTVATGRFKTTTNTPDHTDNDNHHHDNHHHDDHRDHHNHGSHHHHGHHHRTHHHNHH
jgi:hypothetical protein